MAIKLMDDGENLVKMDHINLKKTSQIIIYSIAILFTLTLPVQAKIYKFKIMTEELRPLNYTEKGEVKGLSVEIVREILKILNYPGDIKAYPWARAYNEIQSKPNSILFSMSRNPERENKFKWVGPLITDNVYFYKKRSTDINIKSIEDAKKAKRIAVSRNYPHEKQLRSKGFKNLYITVNPESNIKMLINERVSLIMGSELVYTELMRATTINTNLLEKIDIPIDKADFYIAFSKDTPDKEIKKWQDALDIIKESGKYDQIKKKYLKR